MTRRTWVLLAMAAALAGVVSVFASTNPDGLERVLHDLQISVPTPGATSAPMADYQAPFVQSSGLSGSLAGLAGVLLAFGLGWFALRLLVAPGRKRSPHE